MTTTSKTTQKPHGSVRPVHAGVRVPVTTTGVY